MNARLVVLAWLNVEANREVFLSNGQRALELGLRRDGITVEESAPNYLYCDIQAADADGIIAYSWSVKIFDFRLEGLQQLLWSTGGIGTVGGASSMSTKSQPTV